MPDMQHVTYDDVPVSCNGLSMSSDTLQLEILQKGRHPMLGGFCNATDCHLERLFIIKSEACLAHDYQGQTRMCCSSIKAVASESGFDHRLART